MEPTMTKKNAAPSAQTSQPGEVNLDSRYGKIGISAVVAALHFRSECKNPVYAPVVPHLDEERIADLAA
jgi:hypothetical protein